MKYSRFLILMLGIMAHLGGYAQGYDMEVDGIYYTYDVDAETATVTSAPYDTPYEGSITIPATVTKGRFTFNVIAIARMAFSSTNVEKVTILSDGEKGVRTIGQTAFSYARKLKQVTLPATLESMGKRAFNECSALQAVVLPSSLKSIPEAAFSGCTALETVTFPETMEAGAIGEEAFYNCGITKLTLPKGIEIGGKAAFMYCRQLKEVVFPDDFWGINMSMFSKCTSLEEITFPHSLRIISSDAFSYCHLKKFTIPNSVEGMSWDALYGCTQLEEIIIEDGSAPLKFYYSLDGEDVPALKKFYLGRDIDNDETADIRVPITSLTIGSNVTAMPYSFGDNLKEIISKIKDPTNVTERFTKSAKANAILKVPEGSKELYEQADGWKGFFNIETYKDEGTSIRSIDVQQSDDVWYNLNGQRIATPTRNGLYIKNGKKVMISLPN